MEAAILQFILQENKRAKLKIASPPLPTLIEGYYCPCCLARTVWTVKPLESITVSYSSSGTTALRFINHRVPAWHHHRALLSKFDLVDDESADLNIGLPFNSALVIFCVS